MVFCEGMRGYETVYDVKKYEIGVNVGVEP